MARRRRKALKRSDMDLANIGARFFEVTLGAIPDECGYKKYLNTYLEKLDRHVTEGVGLLLLGEHDRGKTSAAIALLKRALLAGYSGLFLEADRLQGLAIEKRSFYLEMTWMQRAELVDVLVLDDLGMEHTHEFGRALVEGLLRTRHNKRRATFVTTNLSRETITDRYGKGVSGVLRESFMAITVKGKNWRDDRGDDLAASFAKTPPKPKNPSSARSA